MTSPPLAFSLNSIPWGEGNRKINLNTFEYAGSFLNSCVLNIVFLVNLSAKIALILQNADVLSYEITCKKSFFVQNLQHVETKQGIPVFKIPSPVKTILKPSKKQVPKTVKFTKEEKNIASLIDMKELLLDMTPKNAPKIESEPVKSLLSLSEFLQKGPNNITSTTLVEVNFIVC